MVGDGTARPMAPRSPLAAIRVDAAVEAERVLRKLAGSTSVRPLNAGRLHKYRNIRPAHGWRFEVSFEDRVREMDLILPDDFPFSAPRVALVTPPPKGEVWPHVERNGLLCLPETDEARSRDVERLLEHALSDAARLIRDCVTGNYDPADLLEEWVSYWAQHSTSDVPCFKSILSLEPPSRLVRVWWGRKFALFGETDETVRAWLTNRFGPSSKSTGRRTEAALFLWLPSPLLPSEYPTTNGGVLRLARRADPAAANVLKEIASALPERLGVVLGSRATDGPSAVGLTLPKPSCMARGTKSSALVAIPGFRPGKVPPSVKTSMYLGDGTKVERTNVQRVDSRWVHGRDRDRSHERLRSARIALVGCGSVGGVVATYLAQSGVGSLLLVDPEPLTHSNTSRHVLGAVDVGKNKATALEKRLRRAFPHIKEMQALPSTWQEVEFSKPGLLRNCDLIISSVGSWRVERALNEVHVSDRGHPPVLYGWLEEHGIAGHAVLVTGRGGCFHCGFDETGMPLLRVTFWPGGAPVYREPGCSSAFQPYGAVDVAPALALITRTAIDYLLGALDSSIHRTWIGDGIALQEAGGEWDKRWCSKVGEPGPGWCRTEQEWTIRSQCPACMGVAFR